MGLSAQWKHSSRVTGERRAIWRLSSAGPGLPSACSRSVCESVRSGWSPKAGKPWQLRPTVLRNDGPTCAPPGPGDYTALPWPSRVGNEFWCRFGLVGQREEFQARSQWFRIEDSVYPKRICLVESCVDHLTWVFFDHSTWRPPQAGEWLAVSDRVTRGKLGEVGREYFLRRANELFHWVCPLRGSLTRKVWDDLGAYRGLHDAALTALAERDDMHTAQIVQRVAYRSAVAWARQTSLQCRPIGEPLIQCDHVSSTDA